MNLPTLSLHEYCSHLWAPAELFDRVPASKDAREQARPHKRRKLLAALSSRGGSLQRGGDGLSDEELEYGLQVRFSSPYLR